MTILISGESLKKKNAFLDLFLTHPPMDKRIKVLEEMTVVGD